MFQPSSDCCWQISEKLIVPVKQIMVSITMPIDNS